MRLRRIILAVTLEFIAGIALSFIGWGEAAWLSQKLNLFYQTPVVAGRSLVGSLIFSALVGAPVGFMTGIMMLHRILLPSTRTWMGFLVGLVLYDIVILITLYTDQPGYIILISTSVAAMTGFLSCCRLKERPPA